VRRAGEHAAALTAAANRRRIDLVLRPPRAVHRLFRRPGRVDVERFAALPAIPSDS